MKMKSILVSMFALAALASCNNDDDIAGGGGPQGTPGETAFISLKVLTPNGSMTRVNTSKPGTPDEQAVKMVKAVFFNSNDSVVYIKELSITSLSSTVITEPFTIDDRSAKLLLYVNGEGATALKNKITVGESWAKINAVISSVTSAGLTSTQNGFTMANERGLIDITANKQTTSQLAEDVPAVVKIDRLVSKVDVKTNRDGVTSENGEFTYLGWGLSITNKDMFLLSDTVPYLGSVGELKGIYRKDPNYSNNETSQEFIRTHFNVITDATAVDDIVLDGSSPMPQYCLENTMAAIDQKKGVSTKVVIKANYTPEKTFAGVPLGPNASYFRYNGKYYNFAEFKKEYDDYKKMWTDNGLTLPEVATGIWLDADNLAEKVNGGTAKSFEEVTEDWLEVKNAGVVAKGLPIRFYNKSICYYEQTIKHDNAITTDMALGRWGVVRNNWYELTINSVNGPGTPWVPDPLDPNPSDPSQPGDDNDRPETWIAISVTMNPWTFWQQGVDL